MTPPDDARIEAAARCALAGEPPDRDATILATSQAESMSVVLVATDIDGHRCRSLVIFDRDAEPTLDAIHSDVVDIDDPDPPLGPSHLAEGLAVFGPPHIVAVRHADDVTAVVDGSGTILATPSGTGFVIVTVDETAPFAVHARLHDGAVAPPLTVGE